MYLTEDRSNGQFSVRTNNYSRKQTSVGTDNCLFVRKFIRSHWQLFVLSGNYLFPQTYFSIVTFMAVDKPYFSIVTSRAVDKKCCSLSDMAITPFPRTIYLFLRTIIRSQRRLFVLTENYMFVWTEGFFSHERVIVRASEWFSVRTNSYAWERMTIRGNGQLSVPKNTQLSAGKNNCPFPRIKIRSHEKISVRTVCNKLCSFHAP